MRILVIDVGGTHVKLLATGHQQRVEFPSGPKMTPAKMVAAVRAGTVGWEYDAVSIGYPGIVVHGCPISNPHHLGSGWVGFDFKKAFGRPVKIVNDAAMQALGSYHGGRMLFLGLGTGLGSAMIVNNVLEPMELAHLPYKKASRATTTPRIRRAAAPPVRAPPSPMPVAPPAARAPTHHPRRLQHPRGNGTPCARRRRRDG